MTLLKKFLVMFSGGPLHGMQVERLTLPDCIRIPSTRGDRGMEVASYRRMPQERETDAVFYVFSDPSSEN